MTSGRKSKAKVLACRTSPPGVGPLAEATEAYKVASFHFGFWLVEQAITLPAGCKLPSLPLDTFEGYRELNLSPIRQIVNEMCRAGRTFSNEGVEMLTKVIELREKANLDHHEGGDEGHRHWVEQLKEIRDEMMGRDLLKPKKSLDEIMERSHWRQP